MLDFEITVGGETKKFLLFRGDDIEAKVAEFGRMNNLTEEAKDQLVEALVEQLNVMNEANAASTTEPPSLNLAAGETLELTEENVERILDEMRPYLISDGGNVKLAEIDGPVVKLELEGACSSCPSSTVTMRMGLERRLLEAIPEITEVV